MQIFLGTGEIARMMGVHPSYVRRLASQGRMPKPFALVRSDKRDDKVWRPRDIEPWVEKWIKSR